MFWNLCKMHNQLHIIHCQHIQYIVTKHKICETSRRMQLKKTYVIALQFLQYFSFPSNFQFCLFLINLLRLIAHVMWVEADKRGIMDYHWNLAKLRYMDVMNIGFTCYNKCIPMGYYPMSFILCRYSDATKNLAKLRFLWIMEVYCFHQVGDF